MRGRWVLLVFAAWTVLIWAGRVNNILDDADLSSSGRTARLALAGSFVVLGLAVGALALRNRPLTSGGRIVLAAAVLWTIGVWVVRAGGIVMDDHSAAFIAVHLVLAVVSIGLALASARTLRQLPLPFGHAGAQAASAARR